MFQNCVPGSEEILVWYALILIPSRNRCRRRVPLAVLHGWCILPPVLVRAVEMGLMYGSVWRARRIGLLSPEDLYGGVSTHTD